MTRPLAFRSATEQSVLLRSKQASSRELLDLYVERIERLNPSINAVVTLDVETARRRAQAADDATARGISWGPLHGLPITVKDALAVAGMRSTGGAPELSDYVPARSAPVVARLRNAGAIVFGKTNVPKWSLDYVTTNDVFGTTGNPWQPHHVPGGSSGGAAAAISAGLTSLEIGTDLGGSIRLPAHFCGVYGLKPTFGAVSQRGYVDRVGEAQYDVDANHFGPLARSVDDLVTAFRIIALHPDIGAEPRPSLADYRIGAWLDDDACPVDAQVLDRLQRAADATTDAGARMNSSRPATSLRDARALVGPVIAHGLRGPEAFSSPERSALSAAWAAWFEHHDVILWPVAPTTAPRHDPRPIAERRITINGVEVAGTETIGWTGPINVLGLPSVVIPVGRAGDGLPVGMQVIAAWGNDRLALDAASRIDAVLTERGLGGFAVPPGFAN